MARTVPETLFLPPAREQREQTLNQAIKDLYLLLARTLNRHILTTDPPFATLTPTGDVVIPESTSAIALRTYSVASGKLVIESGARFRIL